MTAMPELVDLINRSNTLSPRTKELYFKHLDRYSEYLRDRSMGLTEESSDAWIKMLRRRGMKPQSVNVAINALKYVSGQWAYEAGGVPFAAHLKPLAFKKAGHSRALSFDQAKALIKACRGNEPRDLRDMAIVVVGLRTGMLRSSLCSIQIEDVTDDTLTFIKKGGAHHTIKLDKAMRAAVTPWLVWLKNEGITSGSLFRSISRQRLDGTFDLFHGLTPDGLSRAAKIRAGHAQIKGFHPHTFRHTFTSWAKKADAEPHEIAAILGTHEYRDGEIASPDKWIPASIRP
jgi:integrase